LTAVDLCILQDTVLCTYVLWMAEWRRWSILSWREQKWTWRWERNEQKPRATV